MPNMDQSRYQSRIILWLSIVCMLIITIVMIGGITRLTHSGLSMVDWRPIMGILPPLSEADWQHVFYNYQQFPEYQHVNKGMSLSAFKWIFFWEYAHRMLGRLIGLAIIIPLGLFWRLGWLTPYLIQRGIVMAILVSVQGVMGWLMVKSGLVDVPYVSHIRLMFHLCLAFLLFIYVWWTLLQIARPKCLPMSNTIQKWILGLCGLVVVQIIYGAFVAGLKAGHIMNTFPKMGTHWIPVGVMEMLPIWRNFIDNPLFVQWMHRLLAWGLLVGVVVISMILFQQQLSWFQRRSVFFLLGTMSLQFILGVLTLIYHVPLHIAVAHQIMALLVLTAMTTVYYGTIQHGGLRG